MKSVEDLQESITAIENSIPHNLTWGNGAIELIPYPSLLTNLSGNCGALFIRAILQKLSVNEHQVLKFRLENKFKQYQIFNHFFPGCMPDTLAFSELLAQSEGEQKIRELFNQGYFLKKTLGASSHTTKSWDKTSEFETIARLQGNEHKLYEDYVLQKKLHIKREFRIHTFSKSVIPALSYTTPTKKNPNFHLNAENFVIKVLNSLPNSIIQGTLIGWDIALTEDHKYLIIEANFTGFHPEYLAGFQTTGYVDDPRYGPIICAWLNIFFEKQFGVYIDSIEDSLFNTYPFYRAFIFYYSLLKSTTVDLIEICSKASLNTVVTYLGDQDNILMLNLINHFLHVDFSLKYYVIVRDECFSKISDLFLNNKAVHLLKENQIFNEGQLLLIRQLGYAKRQQKCCYHALKKLNDKSCFIIS
jgi:hypothetical protein